MKEIFIVGGGPAGVKLAQELRIMGFEGKIYLIEDRFLGGECTNVGCIPSKALFNFSKNFYKTKKLFNIELDLDVNNIYNSVRRVVNTIKKGIEDSLKKFEIDVVFDSAKFNNDKIILSNKEFNYEILALATGSYPVNILDLVKNDIKDNSRILDNRSLWGNSFKDFLNDLSKGSRILIVGGGYIGLETATLFSIFKKSLFYIFEIFDRILFNADKEISAELFKNLNKDNINIYTSTKLLEIKQNKNSYLVIFEREGKQEQLEVDYIVSAIGRKPNLPLDLITKKEINFDNYLRLKGLKKLIFALGDVTGLKMLAHKAEYQAKIVAKNIITYLSQNKLNYEYNLNIESLIPGVVFTIPQVAFYGLTEEEAKHKLNNNVIVKRAYFAANSRAIADLDRNGFIKVIYNDLGEILGAHMIGNDVDLLVSTLLSYHSEIVVYPHPTLAEILNELL
ncbi:MAG: NAD(P)/FAD-dependent oxidoreductase [bacterium]|nr:NAD(P)/FAD-dependent oxidoreductase [bacterium]